MGKYFRIMWIVGSISHLGMDSVDKTCPAFRRLRYSWHSFDGTFVGLYDYITTHLMTVL